MKRIICCRCGHGCRRFICLYNHRAELAAVVRAAQAVVNAEAEYGDVRMIKTIREDLAKALAALNEKGST